ncbi:MAG: Txe/YoeB family addiction module toxin [Saprospiraceae bacterium]|nr:Txe/YoeB family addiction module toxin [Saprospiraceae bacterium]
MFEIHFMPNAWKDLGWWVQNDLKTLKKIHSILENISKTPFLGIGQPEPLKANYSGYWSRRINKEHRIIYKFENKRIIVHSLYGHYQV